MFVADACNRLCWLLAKGRILLCSRRCGMMTRTVAGLLMQEDSLEKMQARSSYG